MLQTLSQFLRNCFREVHKKKLKSIAIPAIGTGKLLFPHRLVATVMLKEFRKFSCDHPQTSLRDVRFVVHPKDLAIIQVNLSTITESLWFRYCIKIQDNIIFWHEYIFNSLWIVIESLHDVLASHLEALVTWCFCSWELARKQELMVDRGRELVSLFAFHWWGIFVM